MIRHMLHMFIIASCLAFVGVSASAQAQDFMFMDDLNGKNSIQPLQNPQLKSFSKLKNARVLDEASKTVGEVRDVLMNPNGTISALSVEFDRLRLSGAVPVSYSEMIDRPANGAYYMRISDDRLTEQYPELLAAIATASGNGNEISIKSVIGAPVEAVDGRRLGKIDDVLFADDGNRVDSFYVRLNTGLLRGKFIAVPVNAFEFVDKNSRKQKTAMLSTFEADAVLQVADELR